MLNDLLTAVFIVCTINFQNAFWPEWFGPYFPLSLWIPCLIYWLLYRPLWKATFMLYFISVFTATGSTIPLSLLLLLHSLIFLIILFFKRVYYINWTFFNTATVMSLLLWTPLLWMVSQWLNASFYFPPVWTWLGGGVVSWLFSLPLFVLLQQIDKLYVKKTLK